MKNKVRSHLLMDLISYSRDKEYEKVVSAYDELSVSEQSDSKAVYYLAEAFYELEEDIKSLKQYCKFVTLYPHNKATDFAKMGIVTCLKNLDLHDQALEVLQTISSEHEGIEKEKEHSNEIIKLQFQARKILKDYKTNR